MTASERFRCYLAGEPVDRSPAVEWASWWDLTVERWHKEGLPEEVDSVEEIQAFSVLISACRLTDAGRL